MRVDFWSSTEYATFLPGLVRALGPHGWNARSRFVVSERSYREARSPLQRVLLRSRAYGWYPLRLAAALGSRRRPDVAVVCTNTFYAPWVAERVSRAVPVVHWVFDLFPDVLVEAGALVRGSRRERWLSRCVRDTFTHASANVFLGQHLLKHATARFGDIPRATVIPVGCDASPFIGDSPRTRSNGGPVRVLYCGNLGRMHDVATLLGVLPGGLPEGLTLEIRGNGAGFREVEEALRERPVKGVRLGPPLAEVEWQTAMRDADVALVTMKSGAEGILMPSKTYSALAAGQAVLAICPRNSDLAETIGSHGCGWQVDPGDTAGLGRVLTEIVARPAEVLQHRRNAWAAGQEVFDQRKLAEAWSRVLAEARVARVP